jgi:hypothetical protein
MPVNTSSVATRALVAAAAFAVTSSGCGPDRARGAFPESEHQFGDVVQGTNVVHEFPVHNTTDRDIVIRRIGTANGATVVHVDSVIRPGQRGTIRISLATHSHRGPIDGLANVYTDNPNTPVASLHMRGTVVLPIEVKPKRQAYFFAVKGEPATQVLSLVNHSERPLRVTSVTSDNQRFVVKSEQVRRGHEYRVTVALDPSTPPGKHDGKVTVATDHPQFPQVVIPSFAQVKDSLSTSIDTVQFGQIAYAALEYNRLVTRKSIMVTKHRATDFRVLDATTDLSFLSVEIVPHRPGESFLVNVRMDPKRVKRGPIVGTLRIKTTDPSRPELFLPIRAKIV